MKKILFAFCVFGGFLSTTWASDLAAPTLTDHFTFDGTYASETGSGRVADAPYWCYVPVGTDDGVVGGAAKFDGMSMLSITDTSVLPSTGGWTLSLWEKAELAEGRVQGFFFSDASENPIQTLYLQHYNQQINGRIANVNVPVSGTSEGLTTLPVDGNTWIHHVISLQDNGFLTWYINGEMDGWIRTYPGDWQGLGTTPIDAMHEVGLGIGGSVTESWCYQGYMDDLQIYDGSVTAEMANYLYNNPGQTLNSFTSSIVDPASKTVSRWTFDSDFNESGSGPSATNSGATIDTTQGAYAGSNAVYFDGSGANLTIPGSELGGNAFSLSVWMKSTNNTEGMFLCDTGGYDQLFMRYYNAGTEDPSERWITGWCESIYTQEMGQEGPHDTPFSQDTWVQMVMTMREDGTMTFYLDGEEKSQMTVPEWQGLVGDLMLGAGTDGSNIGWQYTGWLDDLQIYNYTLSDAEVASLYATPGSVIGGQNPDVPGDANRDGKVDGSDVTILAGNWQKGVDDGQTASWEEGDFNGDGKVDGSDVTILAGNWQHGVDSTAASVPEPGSILLLLSGLIAVAFMRYSKR